MCRFMLGFYHFLPFITTHMLFQRSPRWVQSAVKGLPGSWTKLLSEHMFHLHFKFRDTNLSLDPFLWSRWNLFCLVKEKTTDIKRAVVMGIIIKGADGSGDIRSCWVIFSLTAAHLNLSQSWPSGSTEHPSVTPPGCRPWAGWAVKPWWPGHMSRSTALC